MATLEITKKKEGKKSVKLKEITFSHDREAIPQTGWPDAFSRTDFEDEEQVG
jgi:hypothetical protein